MADTIAKDEANKMNAQGKDTTAMDEVSQSKLNADSLDLPASGGGDTIDNSYASSKNEPVPVLKDEEPVEQPNDAIDPDSDKALGKLISLNLLPRYQQALMALVENKWNSKRLILVAERDEKEAIDKSNILKGDRTRHATKPAGTYREPGDEEGLPGPDDGTSNVRGPGVEGAYDNKPDASTPFV